MMKNRALGPYAWLYWALIFCNGLAPQVLWFRRVRMNNRLLFAVSVVVSIGMWLERFVIVVTSLHRDFMPGAWRMYTPTFWDISLFLGTIGFFFSLIFLFVRGLPMISIFEVRDLVHSKSGRRG
jgi:molybdopterin-containing oxidoreductase family membrane subunit